MNCRKKCIRYLSLLFAFYLCISPFIIVFADAPQEGMVVSNDEYEALEQNKDTNINVTVNVPDYTDILNDIEGHVESIDEQDFWEKWKEYLAPDSKYGATVLRSLNNFSDNIAYQPTLSEIPWVEGQVQRTFGYSLIFPGMFDVLSERYGSNYIRDFSIESNELINTVKDDLASVVESVRSFEVDALNTGTNNPKSQMTSTSGYSLSFKELDNISNSQDTYGTDLDLVRAYKILGRDITLMGDQIRVIPSGSINTVSHITGIETPLKSNQRYEITQTFASPDANIRMYQLIPMLYKAANQYRYVEYQFARSKTDTEVDIPIQETPFSKWIDYPHATVNSSHYYTDVYVSRSDWALYAEQAMQDGIVPPYRKEGLIARALSDIITPKNTKGVMYDRYSSNGLYEGDVLKQPSNPAQSAIKIDTDFYREASTEYWDQTFTKSEFFVFLARFMKMQGEPEINNIEKQQLLVMYGASLPYWLSGEERDAVEYLIVRGIIDPEVTDSYRSENMTVREALLYLMRFKDEDSRLTFKQLTLNYDAELIDQGYQLSSISENETNIEGLTLTQQPMAEFYRDILIDINSSTGAGSDSVSSQIYTDSTKKQKVSYPYFYATSKINVAAEAGVTILPYIHYKGIVKVGNKNYYHIRIFDFPANENSPQAKADELEKLIPQRNKVKYLSLNTANSAEYPHSINIPWEEAKKGGIFKAQSTAVQSDGISIELVLERDTKNTFSKLNTSSSTQVFVDDNYAKVLTEGTMKFLKDSMCIIEFQCKESDYDTFRLASQPLDTYELRGKTYEEINELLTKGDSNKIISEYIVEKEDIASSSAKGILNIKIYYMSKLTDGITKFLEKFKTSPKDAKGITSPAYIKDETSMFIPLSYLKKKGAILDMSILVTQEHGDVYCLQGPDNNIYIYSRFNRQDSIKRVITGNMVIDFVNDPSPIIIKSKTQDEYLIDYRVVSGVLQNHLIITAEDGTLTKSINIDESKNSNKKATLRPALGNQNEVMLKTLSIQLCFKNQSVPTSTLTGREKISSLYEKAGMTTGKFMKEAILNLEATNPLANYAVYQKVSGKTVDTSLVVAKFSKDSSNKASLDVVKTLGLKALDGEEYYVIELPSELAHYSANNDTLLQPEGFVVRDTVDTGNKIPLFSTGDYGLQYRLITDANDFGKDDVPDFKLQEYYTGDSKDYPIPLFLNINKDVTTFDLYDFNVNPTSITVAGDLNFIYNSAQAPSAIKVPSTNSGTYMFDLTKATKLHDMIIPTNNSGKADYSMMVATPIGLISRFYPDLTQTGNRYNYSTIGIRRSISTIYFGSVALGNARVLSSKTGSKITTGSYYVEVFTLFGEPWNTAEKGYLLTDSREDSSLQDITGMNIFRLMFSNQSTYVYSLEFEDPNFVNYSNEIDVGSALKEANKWKFSEGLDEVIYDFKAWFQNKNLGLLEDIISLLYLFILNILPRIFLFQMLSLACLSTIARYELVIVFCDKVVDVYKLLSFGIIDVHTVKVKGLFGTTFFAIVLFSLTQRGYALDILSWLTEMAIAFLDR